MEEVLYVYRYALYVTVVVGLIFGTRAFAWWREDKPLSIWTAITAGAFLFGPGSIAIWVLINVAYRRLLPENWSRILQ